jgi:hypothetical protein
MNMTDILEEKTECIRSLLKFLCRGSRKLYKLVNFRVLGSIELITHKSNVHHDVEKGYSEHGEFGSPPVDARLVAWRSPNFLKDLEWTINIVITQVRAKYEEAALTKLAFSYPRNTLIMLSKASAYP